MVFLWFDAEFTSLDLDQAELLQVACMATNGDLKRLLHPEKDINLPVKISNKDTCSPWVKENIPEIVEKSLSHGLSVQTVERKLMAYIEALQPETPPILAGNSIHNDWHIARRLFPSFIAQCHYRLLDVSALKTLRSAWFPDGSEMDKEKHAFVTTWFPEAQISQTGGEHDAYFDVQASVAELSYYRKQLFNIE